MVCNTSNRNLSQLHHGPIHGLIMVWVLTIPRGPLFPQSSPTFSPFFVSLWSLVALSSNFCGADEFGTKFVS